MDNPGVSLGEINSQPATHLKYIGVWLIWVASIAGALSQGQLVFDNRVNSIVVAPVYGLEPGNPGLSQRGNTSEGTPSGTQRYGGAALEGSNYLAQLFAGPPQAAARNLQPVTPITIFRTGTGAGFVTPPPVTVTIPGVPEGASAKVVLRVWHTRSGTVTNWAQVEVDPTILHGESWPFVTAALGGPFRAPPNLTGLQSFNLATGATPGLFFRVNFQPATALVPTGYLADIGLVYGLRAPGIRYGWNTDHQAAARDRNAAGSPDQRHDTFIEMNSNSVWELEVPAGVYAVHLATGDPLATNGQTRLALEGITALQGALTPTQHWVEADALLEARDGKLSLTGFAPPVTNRLCFIEVTRIEPVRLEPPPRFKGAAGFTVQFTGEAGFRYRIESATALPAWQTAGEAATLFDSRFQFIDSSSTNLSRIYRARQVLTGQ
jgi:hypothetical protein